MELTAGVSIADKLRLVRELGRGGMGCVWVADHLTLQRQVAVKFISAGASNEEVVARERFEREARAAAKIDSPHVVHIYDHGFAADDMPYIVMELLRGESLGARLKRGPLDPQQTAKVIEQTAKALSAAHRLGIVHRDIKPDNIFLQELEDEWFAKVLDFGVAKQMNAPEARPVTATGVVVGTPHFMSPEQLLEMEVDFRTDLWALSVVAYRCLIGALPFNGESLMGLCLAITKGNPPPPSAAAHTLGTTFDPWFQRALASDITERFSSAKELASSFAELCRAGPIRSEALTSVQGAPARTPDALTRRDSAQAMMNAAPQSGAHDATGGSSGVVTAMTPPQSPPPLQQVPVHPRHAGAWPTDPYAGASGTADVMGPAQQQVAYGPSMVQPTPIDPRRESRPLRAVGLVLVAVGVLAGLFVAGWLWFKGDTESASTTTASSAARTAPSRSAVDVSDHRASVAEAKTSSGAPPSTAKGKGRAKPVAKPTASKRTGSSVGALRGVMLGCWQSNEGGQPGQGSVQVSIWVKANARGAPANLGQAAPPAKYRSCVKGAAGSMTYLPNESIQFSLTLPANTKR